MNILMLMSLFPVRVCMATECRGEPDSTRCVFEWLSVYATILCGRELLLLCVVVNAWHWLALLSVCQMSMNVHFLVV